MQSTLDSGSRSDADKLDRCCGRSRTLAHTIARENPRSPLHPLQPSRCFCSKSYAFAEFRTPHHRARISSTCQLRGCTQRPLRRSCAERPDVYSVCDAHGCRVLLNCPWSDGVALRGTLLGRDAAVNSLLTIGAEPGHDSEGVAPPP
jgi:hypothetical protein